MRAKIINIILAIIIVLPIVFGLVVCFNADYRNKLFDKIAVHSTVYKTLLKENDELKTENENLIIENETLKAENQLFKSTFKSKVIIDSSLSDVYDLEFKFTDLSGKLVEVDSLDGIDLYAGYNLTCMLTCKNKSSEFRTGYFNIQQKSFNQNTSNYKNTTIGDSLMNFGSFASFNMVLVASTEYTVSVVISNEPVFSLYGAYRGNYTLNENFDVIENGIAIINSINFDVDVTYLKLKVGNNENSFGFSCYTYGYIIRAGTYSIELNLQTGEWTITSLN